MSSYTRAPFIDLQAKHKVIFKEPTKLVSFIIYYGYWQTDPIIKPLNLSSAVSVYLEHIFRDEEKPDVLMFDKLVLTPMLSVMVCPSLKPKSSLGPESPSWALLLISFSCFTHLQGGGGTYTQHQH